MSKSKSHKNHLDKRKQLDARLIAAAREFEQEYIIPHCSDCSRPCCALTDVVLELNWRQAKTLYNITVPQKDFDLSLKSGKRYSCIRKQSDRYYAFGSPCPAYNQKTRLCNVYDTPVKPASCSDFPIYPDEDVLTIDTRCEAVSIKELLSVLRAKAPDLQINATADRYFPMIYTIKQKNKPVDKD